MAKTKHIILTTMDEYHTNFELYKKEFLENEVFDDSIPSDEEIEEKFYDQINMEYEDECMNLDIDTNEIIAIADLGLWDGRRDAYRIVGDNIKNCLGSFECDDYEIYVDGYKNLRGEYHHHDGVNYILFREFKDGITDEQKDNFKYKIVTQQLALTDITKYTKKLGDRIGKVYGW